QHGGYDIEDYLYAKAKGMIPNDYKVFWGYEDEKLFGFAKEKLNNLSKQSKPFNLTMLTVDTHFPTGYWDRNCRSQFPTKYENVMACSSRQVSAFIKWCQTQSWYKDTTIVISGDHPTMNATIQKGTPWDQRLVYTCYINSAVKRDSITRRNFSTQDNFPTTLAAMGVQIQGNRLGLGTNLFSNEKTLLEKYGFNYVDNELKKRSVWMEKQMEASRSNRVDIQQAKGNLPIVKASIEPYTLGQKTATVTINSIKIPKKFKVKSFEVNVSYREDGAYGNTVIVKDPKAGTKVSVDISDEHSQWYIDHYKLKQLYVNVNVSSTSNVKYTVGKGTGKVVWSKEESSQATGKTKTTSIY
ncbi:MAG: sulfatase-like hydrolase/transferase, partial [Intestinibaculum porci]|uniref:sulfatase-like hydrolase/transferase n=1 Tax=Intestinibaculum porci TaxID=2487118 RepID=UPI002409ADE3